MALFQGEITGKKIALIWAVAAAVGGAYGMGYLSPRPPKAPINAKIDWKGQAEPRFAKLDDSEKAWMQRSVDADAPPVAKATELNAPPPTTTADPAKADVGPASRPGVPE